MVLQARHLHESVPVVTVPVTAPLTRSGHTGMHAPSHAPRGTSRLRAAAGFSLPELLLVVVILGLLAAVGLPKINLITRKEKATRAVFQVQGDIERAFAIAARLRKPVRMVFTTSTRSYQVVDDVAGTVYLTQRLDRNSDVGVDAIESRPTSIKINPNGVASDTLNVEITSVNTTRQLSMTRVGLIRRVK